MIWRMRRRKWSPRQARRQQQARKPKNQIQSNIQQIPRSKTQVPSNIQNNKEESSESGSKPRDLEDRTFLFAESMRAFVKQLPRTVSNTEDVRQLVRASGSVAGELD